MKDEPLDKVGFELQMHLTHCILVDSSTAIFG